MNCEHCYGRGFWIVWRPIKGMLKGECIHLPCTHCDGKVGHKCVVDDELGRLLSWFYKSTPPPGPIKVNRKTIVDPVKYWKELHADIKRDNIYVLEMIREDLVALKALEEKTGVEEEF